MQEKMSYAQAVRAAEQYDDIALEPVHPNGRTIVQTDGNATEAVALLLHGYTNAPYQFRILGDQFFERGFNVLIPRMPHHGLVNRMNELQHMISAEKLTDHADRALEIALGLGKRVVVVGLSCGGLLAGWLATQRKGVDQAVLVAPLLGLGPVPAQLTDTVTEVSLRLRNRYEWWDPTVQAWDGGQPHTYPRISTHALAHMMRVARTVRRSTPLSRELIMVINDNDTSVSNELADKTAKKWQATLGAPRVQSYHFDKALALNHDCIDPADNPDNVPVVYPALFKLLGL